MVATKQKRARVQNTGFVLGSIILSMTFLSAPVTVASISKNTLVPGQRSLNTQEFPLTSRIKVAFVRDGNLWVHWSDDPSFSNERQLTFSNPVTDPQWSVDGKWIAYKTLGENLQGQPQRELRVYNISTDRDLSVTQVPINHSPIQYAWSPKTLWIAVCTDQKLHLHQVTGSRVLGQGPSLLGVHGFVWNPHGQSLTVSTWSADHSTDVQPTMELKVLSLNTSVKSLPKQAWLRLPSPLQAGSVRLWPHDVINGQWSEDGHWLALSLAPSPQWAPLTGMICVVNPKNKSIQPLSEGLPQTGWMGWSPDSHVLAWTAGGGTDLTRNKSLFWAIAPNFNPQAAPLGGSDGSMTWLNAHSLVVSRQTANPRIVPQHVPSTSVQHSAMMGLEKRTVQAGEPNLPSKTLDKPSQFFPRYLRHASLYGLTTMSKDSIRILTAPPPGNSDEYPVWLNGVQKLAWLRESSTEATLYTADSKVQNPHPWIRHVDLPGDEGHGISTLSIYCPKYS